MRKFPHPDREQIELPNVLDALSDPTRLAIITQIAREGEVRCSTFLDIASKTNLSYHFAKLREAGVTRTRVEGTSHFMTLRREDLDRRFPGLLDSILAAAKPAKRPRRRARR